MISHGLFFMASATLSNMFSGTPGRHLGQTCLAKNSGRF
jgi:hypothetical protein